MQKIFIFTSLLILGTSCTGTTLSKILKDKLFQPKECLPKIIETYTASNAPRNSIQSDEMMLSVCPQLIESCCLKNNLNDLHSLVLEAVDSLNLFKSQYKYLVMTLAQANELKINSVLKALEDKFEIKYDIGSNHLEDSYEEPIEVTLFKEAVEYIQENKDVMIDDLNKSVDFVISINSRFGCALCDRENLSSFKNMKSKTPTLLLDMAQCKDIFHDQNAISLFRLDRHINYVYNFVRSMVIIEKGSAPRDTFLTEDELSNIPNLIDDCLKETNFMTKLDCKNLCMSVKFFNGNPFYEIEKSIIAGTLMIDSFFKGAKKLTEQELNQEYEKMEDKIAKRLFVMPQVNDTVHIEFLEQQSNWNHGWNIMKFQMNIDTPSKPVIKKKMEEVILRAVRSPEELFQKTNNDIPIVDSKSNSEKILSFMLIAFMFTFFSN